jgi:hypothetical protein
VSVPPYLATRLPRQARRRPCWCSLPRSPSTDEHRAASPRPVYRRDEPQALWYGLNPCIFRRMVPPRPLQLRRSAAFPPAPNSRGPPRRAPSGLPLPAFHLAVPAFGAGPRLGKAETLRVAKVCTLPLLSFDEGLSRRGTSEQFRRHTRSPPGVLSRRSVLRSASPWCPREPALFGRWRPPRRLSRSAPALQHSSCGLLGGAADTPASDSSSPTSDFQPRRWACSGLHATPALFRAV